jgi:hypothetical protein
VNDAGRAIHGRGGYGRLSEALRNIYIAKYEAPPKFNAFNSYRETRSIGQHHLVRKNRYELRAVLEHHNLSSSEVIRDEGISAGQRCRNPAGAPKDSPIADIDGDEIYSSAMVCQIKTYYARETIFAGRR